MNARLRMTLEKEWRLAGDFILADIDPSQIKMVVPSVKEAHEAAARFEYKIIVPELDRVKEN